MTWTEFDNYVATSFAKLHVRSGMLRAQMVVLKTKGLVTHQTDINEIQRLLRERYDVEYELKYIMDEMVNMVYEEVQANKYVLIQENDA